MKPLSASSLLNRRQFHMSVGAGLLGLGLTEFSMHPASVLEVKRAIMSADVGALKARTGEILALTDAHAYRDALDTLSQQLAG